MTLGIMQPYLFPYVGYFSLIAKSDLWIVFDIVQYIRHGWINRNRIIKPSFDDWQYITIPLKKHSRCTLIQDICITDNNDWKKKIINQLAHYRKKAPFYSQTIELLQECFNNETNSIVDFNVRVLKILCDYLGINFTYKIISKEHIEFGENLKPGEWALEICKHYKAEKYINPIGGRDLFDPSQYQEHGIDIYILQKEFVPYVQKSEKFIEGLSIIDMLMFLSPKDINEHINACTFEKL